MKNINYFKKFSIGTAQLGMNYGVANTKGQLSLEEMSKILSYAKKKGVNSLDTAIDYGESERILGKLNVKHLDVTTKISNLNKCSKGIKEFTLAEIKKSLYKLNRNTVNGILLHNSNDLLKDNKDRIYDALLECKHSGLCNKIGISSYSYAEVSKIIKNYDIDLVQIPLNVFDRNLIYSGLLKELKAKNIEIQIRSVFLQGLLLMKRSDRNPYFNQWKTLFKNWDKWLIENEISNLEACLGFVFNEENIDKVIIGVDSYNHIVEIGNYISNLKIKTIPNALSSNDEALINPSMWKLIQN